jgi:hypothetical protein
VDGIINAGDGFYVYTPGDWWYWLQTSFLPYALVDVTQGGQLYRGYVAQYGLITGGIRLVQTRSTNGSCPVLTSALQTLYGKPCHAFATVSAAANWGNMTTGGCQGGGGACDATDRPRARCVVSPAASEGGIVAAFQPVAPPDGSQGTEFQ